MKAIVQTGPESVEVQERDAPDPGPGEVLVQVHTVGLCSSDAHAYRYEWIAMPRIMGHEYSGTVAEVDRGVEAFELGTRSSRNPSTTAGSAFSS